MLKIPLNGGTNATKNKENFGLNCSTPEKGLKMYTKLRFIETCNRNQTQHYEEKNMFCLPSFSLQDYTKLFNQSV